MTRRTLALEELESRALPSAVSILASLQDVHIQVLAQADTTRDGTLTRNDMIGIFKLVAHEGKILRTAELSDLTTLVGNAKELGMPEYVESLSSKVVGYNPANTQYRGKSLLRTGQLTTGQPSWKLTDLIDKWFLGLDLPRAVDAWGIPHSYAAAKGSLFGPDGPSNLDVRQGAVGDCYFLSPLAEAALRAPQAIKDMFVDNGDGTYTVRFYEQVGAAQVADYVTVNREFPVASGRFVFADAGQPINRTTNVLWVALVEKAYAQLAREGWSRVNDSSPANSYAAIDGGCGNVALQQILGEPSSSASTLDVTAVNGIIGDLQSGYLVTLASQSSVPTKSHVITDHEYYVTAYDAGAGTFTVVNPWGASLKTVGTLHLTATQIASYFFEYDSAAGSLSQPGPPASLEAAG
jgi:hypothetical protein